MEHKFYVIITRVNIARPICQHLIGEEHTHQHRMLTGVVIMAVGVCIAKYFGHSEYDVVAYVGDGIGYGIHGLGLTPFVEYLLAKFAE